LNKLNRVDKHIFESSLHHIIIISRTTRSGITRIRSCTHRLLDRRQILMNLQRNVFLYIYLYKIYWEWTPLTLPASRVSAGSSLTLGSITNTVTWPHSTYVLYNKLIYLLQSDSCTYYHIVRQKFTTIQFYYLIFFYFYLDRIVNWIYFLMWSYTSLYTDNTYSQVFCLKRNNF